MKLATLLKGNRLEHKEAADCLARAAEFWLPHSHPMARRRLIDEWIAAGRRAAEGR